MTEKKLTEAEIMKPWEKLNIDFTNPCYLCKNPLEMPNRKKNFKCNLEECEWLKVWAALQKALYEIDSKNAEIDELQHEKTELQHKIEKLNFENLQMVANIKGLEARAIKEFAERLNDKIEKARQKYQRLCKEQGEKEDEAMNIHFRGIAKIVDKIAKEMGVEL